MPCLLIATSLLLRHSHCTNRLHGTLGLEERDIRELNCLHEASEAQIAFTSSRDIDLFATPDLNLGATSNDRVDLILQT